MKSETDRYNKTVWKRLWYNIMGKIDFTDEGYDSVVKKVASGVTGVYRCTRSVQSGTRNKMQDYEL